MRIRSVFKQFGWIDGALYGISRVLEMASGHRLRLVKYYLVAQPIGARSASPVRQDASATIRRIERDDPLVAHLPRPQAIMSRRFDAGATCTALLMRGEFAGFIWLQSGCYEEDELRCTFVLQMQKVSVWDFDVYVEPKYRIGRAMARLWSHVDAELAAQGIQWSFSRISAFNSASLASHARLGAEVCGSAVFVLIGPLQLSWLPEFPYVHASFSELHRPVVRLRPPR